MPQQSITEMQSGHSASFSAMVHHFYIVKNEEQYEKCLCNQSSHYRIYDRMYALTINLLKCKVAILLQFQLCLTYYAALQTKNGTT